MTPFTLQEGERVPREDKYALWMKSNLFAKPGCLTLTDRRLVFDEDPTVPHGFFSQLIVKRFLPSLCGGVRFDIPLKEIGSANRDSFGNNVMLALIYSGEKKVRIGVAKCEEWDTALCKARSGASSR